MENIKFAWSEDFGDTIGTGSLSLFGKYFDSFEEAFESAKTHVFKLRFTKKEMELAKKKNYIVIIEKIFLDEDMEEVNFESIDAVQVNEETVCRVY